MLSKYDSLEFKGNNSFVSSQTLNVLPHFGSMNKTFSKRRLCGTKLNDCDETKELFALNSEESYLGGIII